MKFTPLVTALLWLVGTSLSAESPIGGLKSDPGTVVHGKIAVPAGADGAAEIPVTIFNGAKPGPTLTFIAATHGSEYPASWALHQIVGQLKSADIAGRLVLVPIANLPAYVARSSRETPADHKDLNQTFPGRANGTMTERIAYAITAEIIEKSDYVVHLRSGAVTEGVVPYLNQPVTGDSKLDAKIVELSSAFNMNQIVVDKNPSRPKDPAHSITLENTALTRGKPSFTVVCGSMGIIDTRTIDQFIRGINSVMSLLHMTEGKPLNSRAAQYIDETALVESPATGLAVTYVLRGQHVKRGEELFAVNDYNNQNPKVVKAPIDGVVLTMLASPPVAKGDPVALIGKPRE